jgi:hypothetical protein
MNGNEVMIITRKRITKGSQGPMTVHKVRELGHRVDARMRRGAKYVQQVQAHQSAKDLKPIPLFVVGCQRSGTNMIIDVLDKSPDTWVYNENHRKAFDTYRIKPLADRMRLIRNAHCQWVVFKPICDSQNIDRLLADHPGSKAIWVYRRYQYVANSALRKWGERQLELIREAATNENWDYWFVDRMSNERRQLIKELYSEDMSWHTAGALKWYARNAIYFDYGLDQRPEQVKLVKYEDLVREPLTQFKAIFDFLNLDFDRGYISELFDTSIQKENFLPIDPQVEELCEEMMSRLNQALEPEAVPVG